MPRPRANTFASNIARIARAPPIDHRVLNKFAIALIRTATPRRIASLHVRVIRPAAAFRYHPIDVLLRVLNVAGFAMHAILRVDLQPLLAGPGLFDDLVDAGRDELRMVGVMVKSPRRPTAQHVGVEGGISQPTPQPEAKAGADVAHLVE